MPQSISADLGLAGKSLLGALKMPIGRVGDLGRSRGVLLPPALPQVLSYPGLSTRGVGERPSSRRKHTSRLGRCSGMSPERGPRADHEPKSYAMPVLDALRRGPRED